VTLTVLLGGARAGKSALALELAARWGGPVSYVATAEARDDEMAARIAQHQRERPEAWATVEEPLALGRALDELDDDRTVIVDCLTLWVSNLVERGDSETAVVADAERVARRAASRPAPVIVVTNEVGLGIVPANELARVYRDLLGQVNAVFVAHADRAGLVVAGRLLQLGDASTW
jgi:adenosylcobinamide kinase / adenosylcobinamide-phosphate guanylyltransferase